MMVSWRRVLAEATVWAMAVTLLYTLLNWPILEPAKFWGAIHPDQAMMVGFMQKIYGLAAYSRDFVFSTVPSPLPLYNPVNLWLLHLVCNLFGGNEAAAFLALLLGACLLYVAAAFTVIRFLTNSTLVAAFVSAISTQFAPALGDGWGISVIGASRANYYVMSIAVLAMGLHLWAARRDALPGVFLASFVIGVAAIIHPLTGCQLFGVLSTVGFLTDIWMRKAWARRLLMRGLGFALGAMPTIVTVVHNRPYGGGGGGPADAAAIFQGLQSVLPLEYCLMPDILFLGPRQTAFVAPLTVFCLFLFLAGCLLCGLRLLRVRIQNQTLARDEIRKLWAVLFLSAMPVFISLNTLVGVWPLVGRVLPIGFVTLVLCVYFLQTWKRGSNSIDHVSLMVISVTLLFTVGASWAVNAFLDYIHYPLRVGEFLRGFKIAWMVIYLYLALVLTAPRTVFWSSFSRPAVAAVAAALFAIFLVKLGAQNSAPMKPAQRDLYTLCQWAKQNTPADALFGTVLADAAETTVMSIKFKAYSQRSMVYSYDAQVLAWTDRKKLIEAKRRLDDIQVVRTHRLSLTGFMDRYSADYVIVENPMRHATDVSVAYENPSFIVLRATRLNPAVTIRALDLAKIRSNEKPPSREAVGLVTEDYLIERDFSGPNLLAYGPLRQ